GGIAHDFNNILTGILGNISLAQTLTDKGSELNKILTASAEASLRAKELTQQLLTFAKGGDPVKRVTNLEAIITDSTKFVLRGSNVKCVFDFARDLKPAKIDAGQISQVIQNIVSNADQAMPSGGIIKIKVENTRPSDSEQIELKSDDHLKITIEDQGCGIPPELIDNVFDPYFTTKTENSGLGLAITHSIINKHGGTITIETETDPNKKTGSTFSIYLPTTAQGKTAEPAEPTTRKIKSANITILIMDDEVMISELLKRILHKKGYKTITATDGEEALELYKETCASGGQIDLSILDLTVPGGMGGQETAQHLLKLNPQAKIVVSSGYFNDPIMANFKDYGFKAALTKPFQMVELLSTIENALVE
ncbi:response regulator, partial [bacterium]|nr:response regulator [bacterium]